MHRNVSVVWSECVPFQISFVETLTPRLMYQEVGSLGGDEVMRVEPLRMGLVPL